MSTVRFYTPDDEPLLQQLASAPLPGWVRLHYNYANGYAAGESLKGDSCEIRLVEDESGHLQGCWTRTVKTVWLDGAKQRIGYISGMRSFPQARNRLGFFRGLQEQWKREQEDGCVLNFSTVLADNDSAIKLFTSRRKNMPICTPQGMISTYLLPPSSTTDNQPPIAVDELEFFYQRESPRRQLFPVFSSVFPPNLSAQNFFCIRRNGRIAAAAAIWHHGNFRKIIIDGYQFPLGLLRAPINLLSGCLHSPLLPSVGSILPCAYLTWALVENDSPELFIELLNLAVTRTAGANLVISLHEKDRLSPVMSKLRTWKYDSTFMTVAFGNQIQELNSIPHIEAGAL